MTEHWARMTEHWDSVVAAKILEPAMSRVTKLQPLSVEEYLAGEPESQVKREYVNGKVSKDTSHWLTCTACGTVKQNKRRTNQAGTSSKKTPVPVSTPAS